MTSEQKATAARVERWAVITPSGMMFPYNEKHIAEKLLPQYIAGSRVGLVREVDPASDAAVARLVEAARNVAAHTFSDGTPVSRDEQQAALVRLVYLFDNGAIPALPGAANGEPLAKPVAETVASQSSSQSASQSQPAMPPEGTKVRCWRHKDGFKDGVDRVRWDGVLMWFIRNDAEPRVATLTVKQAEEAVERGSWVECPDAPYIPPTPPQPSGESAEAVADRVVVLGGGPGTRVEYAKKVAKLIRSRDAAHQARHAAEVARLFAESERVCAEAAKALDERDDARRAIAAKDAEIARLKACYDMVCDDRPESRLADVKAKDAEIEKLTKNLKVAIEQRDDAQAEAFSLRTRLAAKGGT